MPSHPPFAVVRADATPEIGNGHVMRCLVLAAALREAGWTLGFAYAPDGTDLYRRFTRPETDHLVLADAGTEAVAMAAHWPSGCDLLIVDHYGRGDTFERSCRTWAKRVLVIDDFTDRHHDCDFLLNPTPGISPADYADHVPGGCSFLLGPRYALLRPQFTAARPQALARRGERNAIGEILVSLGATDPDNMTAIVLQGLAATGLDVDVTVVLGSAAPHITTVRELSATLPLRSRLLVDTDDMASLMSRADLAIGAGGGSSWERCCLGLPALLVVTADNQRRIADSLAAAGAAEMIGDWRTLDAEIVRDAVARLVADAPKRHAMSHSAAGICDGTGVARVVDSLQ